MGTSSRNPLPLGALVLVLCALVAATFDGPRWDDARGDAERPTPAESDPGPAEAEEATPEEPPPPEDDDEPWLPWAPPVDVLLLLPAALVLGVALVVIARLRLVRRRNRLTRRRGVRSAPVGGGLWPPDEDEDADLSTALDEGARIIGEGSARNAIVAAWVRLEQAVESERFEHRPQETPSELVERALTAYRLDGEAIRRLAALYREARFSSHPVTEDHRVEAADCLQRLLTALPARSR